MSRPQSLQSRPRHPSPPFPHYTDDDATQRAILAHDLEQLATPDGLVGPEAVDLLDEFVHPSHLPPPHPPHPPAAPEHGEGDDDADELKSLPWYRKPSPWFLLALMPFWAIALISTLAPRVQLYTELACCKYKPEYCPSGIAFSSLGSPTHEESCATDAKVQAEVAKLMSTTGTIMGILTCLCTGWWGSLTDIYGRRRIIAIAVFGMLLADVNVIIVSHFSAVLPGHYWFLLVGAFIEGSLGGMTTSLAAISAYTADCVSSIDRSRFFSLISGSATVGAAVGPTIGSLIIHLTHDPRNVFYMSIAMRAFFVGMVVLVVPESLSRASMANGKAKRKAQAQAQAQAQGGGAEDEREGSGRKMRMRARAERALGWCFGFLRPLRILAPVVVESPDGLTRLKPRRDWRLTLVMLSYAAFSLLTYSYPFKLQYMIAAFGWNSETLGYFISVISVARAIFLMLMLPAIMLFFKSKLSPIHLPSEPNEPLSGPSDPPTDIPIPAALATQKHASTSTFDLALAQFCLGVEFAASLVIPLLVSSVSFVAVNLAATFATGYGPAIESLMVEVYLVRHRLLGLEGEPEIGALFGAMSVAVSLCQDIISPALFGFTYARTVESYPPAIYLLSAATMVLSSVFLMFVRLRPQEFGAKSIPADREDEFTLEAGGTEGGMPVSQE